MTWLMLYVLTCEVLFPATAAREAFRIRNVQGVSIETSWKSLTDTATIELPTKWVSQEQRITIRDWVKPGDEVQIWLGYDGNLVQRFAGYVARVQPTVPLVIDCEDAMWLLKRRRVSLSYPNVSLRALLADLAGTELPTDADDIDLGKFRVVKATPARVLESLQKKYGLVAYVQNGTLICGKVYRDTRVRVGTFKPDTPSVLADDLEYETGRAISVTAISNLPGGEKIEVQLGDPDGDGRTLNFYGIESQAELRKLAEAELAKLAPDGYQGSFTAYGAVPVSHSDILRIQSARYPERDGDYYVESVAMTFSRSGYRQKISLGAEAT